MFIFFYLITHFASIAQAQSFSLPGYSNFFNANIGSTYPYVSNGYVANLTRYQIAVQVNSAISTNPLNIVSAFANGLNAINNGKTFYNTNDHTSLAWQKSEIERTKYLVDLIKKAQAEQAAKGNKDLSLKSTPQPNAGSSQNIPPRQDAKNDQTTTAELDTELSADPPTPVEKNYPPTEDNPYNLLFNWSNFKTATPTDLNIDPKLISYELGAEPKFWVSNLVAAIKTKPAKDSKNAIIMLKKIAEIIKNNTTPSYSDVCKEEHEKKGATGPALKEDCTHLPPEYSYLEDVSVHMSEQGEDTRSLAYYFFKSPNDLSGIEDFDFFDQENDPDHHFHYFLYREKTDKDTEQWVMATVNTVDNSVVFAALDLISANKDINLNQQILDQNAAPDPAAHPHMGVPGKIFNYLKGTDQINMPWVNKRIPTGLTLLQYGYGIEDAKMNFHQAYVLANQSSVTGTYKLGVPKMGTSFEFSAGMSYSSNPNPYVDFTARVTKVSLVCGLTTSRNSISEHLGWESKISTPHGPTFLYVVENTGFDYANHGNIYPVVAGTAGINTSIGIKAGLTANWNSGPLDPYHTVGLDYAVMAPAPKYYVGFTVIAIVPEHLNLNRKRKTQGTNPY